MSDSNAILIDDASREALLGMWKRYAEARDSAQAAFTGFQEFIVYLKTKLNVPLDERWELTKDAAGFYKIEAPKVVPQTEPAPAPSEG